METLTASKKMVSPSVEDYLKAIWTLSERSAAHQTAGTKDLAKMLLVTPPAVSKMLKQIERQVLIIHVPYYGVRLTSSGRKIALRIVRRHRLLELFLAEILGYDPESVHGEAERLEHHISDEFEQRIDSLLGFPKKCPHGSPIPNQEGNFQEN